MKKALLYITCIFSFFALIHPCKSQDGKNYIDNHLNGCLTSIEGRTAKGRVGCYKIAQEKWEEKMNENLNLLMTEVGVERKTDLKNSQQQWIKFKQDEFKFLETMFTKENEYSHKLLENEKTRILKDRALLLQDYYEAIVDQNHLDLYSGKLIIK